MNATICLRFYIRKIQKKNKFLKVEKYLLKCKVLLKGLNGTGMNYIVGYRN